MTNDLLKILGKKYILRISYDHLLDYYIVLVTNKENYSNVTNGFTTYEAEKSMDDILLLTVMECITRLEIIEASQFISVGTNNHEYLTRLQWPSDLERRKENE